MNAKLISRVILAAGLVVLAVWYIRPGQDENPLRADGQSKIAVLEFSKLAGFDTLPKGWAHRTFWFKPAMELARVTHEGTEAIQCKTDGSGSILGRSTDISLTDYPVLSWDWFVEQPITSDIDETTKEGDDHPARLFIRFEDSEQGEHSVEIIWSNRMFKPGDYKYIGDFAHYVANGLDENIGRWHHQQVDLLGIYRTTTGRDDAPMVKAVAIFCDSDNTGGQSIAYFSDVWLERL